MLGHFGRQQGEGCRRVLERDDGLGRPPAGASAPRQTASGAGEPAGAASRSPIGASRHLVGSGGPSAGMLAGADEAARAALHAEVPARLSLADRLAGADAGEAQCVRRVAGADQHGRGVEAVAGKRAGWLRVWNGGCGVVVDVGSRTGGETIAPGGEHPSPSSDWLVNHSIQRSCSWQTCPALLSSLTARRDAHPALREAAPAPPTRRELARSQGLRRVPPPRIATHRGPRSRACRC
jgi:hypothetical protein